jgi:hypothetical protein
MHSLAGKSAVILTVLHIPKAQSLTMVTSASGAREDSGFLWIRKPSASPRLRLFSHRKIDIGP